MDRDEFVMLQVVVWEQERVVVVVVVFDVLLVFLVQWVEKIYCNGMCVFDEVKFDIGCGEFVLLLGFLGCGKSILLKMFVGLEELFYGYICWWGGNLVMVGMFECMLVMVFQEVILMFWVMVEQNVRLLLELCYVLCVQVDVWVVEVLKLVGLEKFYKVLLCEFFGGMQMCVFIVCVLVILFNLLLMDEFFGVLDEFICNKFDVDLCDIWSKQDLIVVFVIYSIYEVVFLFLCVIVMVVCFGWVIVDVVIEVDGLCDEVFCILVFFMQYCKMFFDYFMLVNQ